MTKYIEGNSARKLWKSLKSSYGVSQRALAQAAGLSRSTIKRDMRKSSVSAEHFKAYKAAAASIRKVEVSKQRSAKRAADRAAVAKARADTSPIPLNRGISLSIRNKGTETATGDMAGKIHAGYTQANINRRELGMKEISPKGYFGNPKKLVSVLRRTQSKKALRARRKKGQLGFLSSMQVAAQRSGKTDEQIQKLTDAYNSLSDDEKQELYEKARSENWDVLTSPKDEDGNPAIPDVSGLYDALGIQEPQKHAVIW